MAIEIVEVVDPGGINEYLVLDISEDVNMKHYAVIDTTYDEEGNISNKERHIYQFEDIEIKEGYTIFLFTGKPSKYVKTFVPTKTHVFYWGLEDGHRIWNKDGDLATLIEYKVKHSRNV